MKDVLDNQKDQQFLVEQRLTITRFHFEIRQGSINLAKKCCPESFWTDLISQGGEFGKEKFLIADLEDLEKFDASEIHPRRINAKEMLITQKMMNSNSQQHSKIVTVNEIRDTQGAKFSIENFLRNPGVLFFERRYQSWSKTQHLSSRSRERHLWPPIPMSPVEGDGASCPPSATSAFQKTTSRTNELRTASKQGATSCEATACACSWNAAPSRSFLSSLAEASSAPKASAAPSSFAHRG